MSILLDECQKQGIDKYQKGQVVENAIRATFHRWMNRWSTAINCRNTTVKWYRRTTWGTVYIVLSSFKAHSALDGFEIGRKFETSTKKICEARGLCMKMKELLCSRGQKTLELIWLEKNKRFWARRTRFWVAADEQKCTIMEILSFLGRIGIAIVAWVGLRGERRRKSVQWRVISRTWYYTNPSDIMPASSASLAWWSK